MKKPNIEELRLPLERGEYKTRLYRGLTKNGFRSDFEDLIVIAPGWLGGGTLHFAASNLARQGHDVAVVSHHRTFILHPNADRSRNVHLTAKAGSRATSKKGVILIGHSNGVQDIHHAAEASIKRQVKERDDPNHYVVRGVGAAAGSGLSGRMLNGCRLAKEISGFGKILSEYPSEELTVVARSVGNFARRPLLRIIEGIGALTCDIRPKAALYIGQAGVRSFAEGYLENDGVITFPEDRKGYYIRPGSHLTPVIDEGFLPELAEMLYEPTDLSQHELLAYGRAA